MAKVTIKTHALTLSKIVRTPGQIDEANVIMAIVALVDAYDAAHSYKEFSVREHLIDALGKKTCLSAGDREHLFGHIGRVG